MFVFMGWSPLSGWACGELSGRRWAARIFKSRLAGLRQFWPLLFGCLCCEVVHCGNSAPACSATMKAAYQSGQFASRCPVRFSCSP